MIDKKANRLRRARATRARIRHMNVNRLTVHRTNLHIYAQIISADGKNVLCAASTLEPEARTSGSRVEAAHRTFLPSAEIICA